MNKIITIMLILTITIFAQTINIAVATNVSYAINDLKAEFIKTNPNINVLVTLGSSGKLTAQIKNGAPYGLFMSANMQYPNSLYKDNIAITKPIVYAKGALAYFSTKKQDFSKGINLLKDKNIQRIAIANPKTAPYGKASVEAMKNANIYKDIKSKFVYAESISQTVAYTVTAADIGIIAKSLLYSPNMSQYKEGVNWYSLNHKLYTPINQGIVLLKYGKNSKAYKQFYDFILSKKSKKIFKSYGYILP